MKNELLDKIGELLKNETPLFLLRKKGQSHVRVLHQLDQKLHKTAPDKMAYACFNKFETNDNQYFIYGDVDEEFNYNYGSDPLINEFYEIPEETTSQKKNHIKIVETAIDELKKEGFEKVVLSRKLTIKGTFEPVKILENLLNTYPDANCYFWFHPEIGQWCGATPEILLKYSGNILHTMSLAGTLKKTINEEPIWGNKEKEEQQIVTDSIVKDLLEVGVDHLKIGDQNTVTAGDLFHLQTQIHATISPNKSVEDYLKVLHPTPAVCGLPKDKAQQFICNHEGYDRSFYTGYLGLIDTIEHEYFVNLRCMQLCKDGVILYAGGGITVKSDAESEYAETVNKMRTMGKLLH